MSDANKNDSDDAALRLATDLLFDEAAAQGTEPDRVVSEEQARLRELYDAPRPTVSTSRPRSNSATHDTPTVPIDLAGFQELPLPEIAALEPHHLTKERSRPNALPSFE